MSYALTRATPAELFVGCTFAPNLNNAEDIARAGGAITGNPTFDDDGIVLDGTNDYATFTLNGSEFNSSAISIVFEFWPGFDYDENMKRVLFSSTSDDYRIRKEDNAASNTLNLILGGNTVAAITSATYSPYWRVNERNTIMIAGVSGSTYAWLNGNVILSADATAWNIQAIDTLVIGAAAAGNVLFKGKLGTPKIFNTLLDGQDALNYYNHSMYSYRENALIDLPMRAENHSPSHTNDIELLTDGDMEAGLGSEEITDSDMEAAGTAAWTVGNSATLTKDATDPHAGTQCLRVAYNSVANPFAYQSTLVTGRTYYVHGWFRGDGSYAPRFYSDGAIIVNGTSSTSWQEFSLTFVANGATARLYAIGAGAGYAEFDDISVKETCPDWTAFGTPMVTKETGTPHEGTQCLRVAYGGVTNPFIQQAVQTIGKKYRAFGWARGDGGAGIPRYREGAIVLWDGTNSNTWQYYDVTYVATSAYARWYLAAVSGYAEFDDVSVEEVVPSTLDISGKGFHRNNNHAVFGDQVTSTTFPTKLSERGYYFDGGDYLDLPITAFPGESGSIFMCVSDIAAGTQLRLACTNHSSGSNYQMRTYRSGIYIQVHFGLGTGVRVLASNTAFPFGTLVTFGWTWERSGSSNTYKLYQNGVIVNNATHTEAAVISPDLAFELMRWTTVYTTGNMCRALIAEEVLSPIQVADLHLQMLDRAGWV